MTPHNAWFDRLDRRITQWMARNGLLLLRLSIGIVFVWFGVVKFVPGLSPADGIATRTFEILSFGMIEPPAARVILATWEVAIGLGLLSGIWMRLTLVLMGLQLVGAMTPLILLPDETWKVIPVVLTIEGQYIVKDAIILAAGLVLGATVRGGQLVAEPGKDPAAAHRN
ncbi:MAG: DoxX family membrane protein [Pyrinomonadaceae bacterium]|nr:DoxX family membrane protein [Phycisphaerales bacterium]